MDYVPEEGSLAAALLAAEVANGLAADLRKVRAQRDAVLAIHERYEPVVNTSDGGMRMYTRCAFCRHDDGTLMTWPCPTASALGVGM